MNYTSSSSSSSSSEALHKKFRMEERSEEEKALRDNVRSYWPESVMGNPQDSIPRATLRAMRFEHDRPHMDCGAESWYLNGRFGEQRQRRYSLFVCFSTTAVVNDANPPAVGTPFTNACVLNWSITDHKTKKYYRFSELDHRTPVLLPALIAKRQVRGETHLMQAMVEQLSHDRSILPDRIMEKPTTIRLNELDLQFNGSYLKEIAPSTPPEGVPPNQVAPTYKLHLEGCTFETGDTDMAQEVKAVVELVIEPRLNPALDGDHGVVSTGNWEDDTFCYFTPHIRLKSGLVRLTRASDDLEVSRELDVRHGSLWMERRFGGVVPHTPAEGACIHALRKERQAAKLDTEEMSDRCMLRLHNEDQDCLCVTHWMETPSGATRAITSVVQSAKSKEAYYYDGNSETSAGVVQVKPTTDPQKLYRSKETGTLFPTEWTVCSPLHDGRVAELVVTAEVANQEFVTAYTQPSFWEGAVMVSGTITEADGTTKTPVLGEGFVSSRGRGMQVKMERLFNLLHTAGVVPMENAEVAKCSSWTDIAEGPALSAVSTVSVLFNMQERTLTDAHKIILIALLSVYGYIFHHSENLGKVTEALEWCCGKWVSFFGVSPIDFNTLVLRSFMLRELGSLMTAKCPAAVGKKAVALDIATPRPHKRSTSTYATEAPPSEAVLSQPATALELSQLKALLDGKWELKSTKGSMNDVLVEQGVGVLWRNLIGKVTPAYVFSVDRTDLSIVMTTTTYLERTTTVFKVDGTSWEWNCPGRGWVTSQACITLSGRQLFIEMYVLDGVQRSWYTIDNTGKALLEKVTYFASTEAEAPIAECERVFVLDKTSKN